MKQKPAKPLNAADHLEIRKGRAKRQSAKKRRKRRPVTQACLDIECPSVKLKDRADGKLGCNTYCLRITCPLEEEVHRIARCSMCTGLSAPLAIEEEPPICAEHCALYQEWKKGR